MLIVRIVDPKIRVNVVFWLSCGDVKRVKRYRVVVAVGEYLDSLESRDSTAHSHDADALLGARQVNEYLMTAEQFSTLVLSN